MIKIAKMSDMVKVEKLIPQKVSKAIEETLTILDEMYGEDRNIENDLGGYAVILEGEKDIEKLKEVHLDIYQDFPEVIEKIEVSQNMTWIKLTFLLSSDYAIIVVGNTEVINYNRIQQWGLTQIELDLYSWEEHIKNDI